MVGSMNWLKMHTSIVKHPKLRKLARQLKIHPMQALGHLSALWCHVAALDKDGVLDSYSEEDISIAAEWDGNETEFVGALVLCRFLDMEQQNQMR